MFKNLHEIVAMGSVSNLTAGRINTECTTDKDTAETLSVISAIYRIISSKTSYADRCNCILANYTDLLFVIIIISVIYINCCITGVNLMMELTV